jgi:homocysteine S-methyltransferase
MASTAAGPDWLDKRIRDGVVILIDGAMGTELEARGVPMDEDAWCGPPLLEYGDVVRQIHEDYIRAGAEVIITNTFATGGLALGPVGQADMVGPLNRRAVTLALEARDAAAERPVAIAGSISHTSFGRRDPDWYNERRFRECFSEQAELLAEGGCDLLALEMMSDPEVAPLALEAALATGLPVWVGISVERDAEGRLYGHGDPSRDLDLLLERLTGLGGGLYTVLHSDVPDTGLALAAVRRYWSGPTGAYPNSGYFEMPHWQFVDIISPDDLAMEASRWVAAGTQVIGGCCGLGVDHIERLRERLPARL